MNKIAIMYEMGWTSRQFFEENTAEDIAQLAFVTEKMSKVKDYPKPPAPPSGHASSHISIGHTPHRVTRRYH